MAEIHLRIVGRVQGVGFRWFVCEKALDLGVAGWVKNTRDGDVELAASGDAPTIALLETAVTRGPRGALVTAIHKLPPPDDASYPSPFRIQQ